MKKIISLKERNFYSAMKGAFVPFIFVVLLFASCMKEDSVTPNQTNSGQPQGTPVGLTEISARLDPDPIVSRTLPEIPANALIYIRHGACFGNCPSYSVTITQDATVIYNGKGNVGVFGEYRYRIDHNKLVQLQYIMALNGFTELETFYPYVTDLPETVTALRTAAGYKIVVDYGVDAPKALADMREAIEANVGVNHLVNGDNVEHVWLGINNQ